MTVGIIIFLYNYNHYLIYVTAITFLSLVLAIVPPKDFHYRISTEGVKIEDHFYIWAELYDFYFKRIDNMEVLIVRTESLLPGELKISLENLHRDHVRQILVRFLEGAAADD